MKDISKAIELFSNYVDNFNLRDTRIQSKYHHSLRVMELCCQISDGIGLVEDRLWLSSLTGLFHDIGRFPQIRDYNTFEDSRCPKPHALISVDVIAEEPVLKDYFYNNLTDKEYSLLRMAIKYHTAMLLPKYLEPDELMYCNIVRDADKIDIIKVLSDKLKQPEIFKSYFGYSYEDLLSSKATDGILDSMYRHEPIDHNDCQYLFDYYLIYLTFVYQLSFKSSKILLSTAHTIENIMAVEFTDPHTKEIWTKAKRIIEDVMY